MSFTSVKAQAPSRSLHRFAVPLPRKRTGEERSELGFYSFLPCEAGEVARDARLRRVTEGASRRVQTLRKRSVSLAGHATSLALEPAFWAVLEELAKMRAVSVAGLIAGIDTERAGRPLASACRLAALRFARER